MSAATRQPRAKARRAQLASAGSWPVAVANIVIVASIVVFGALAAMPIYETPTLWLVAAVSSVLAAGTVWLGERLRWGAMTLGALVLVFVVIVVPLAVPSVLGAGPMGMLQGLGDGLAATALGWKQLLTLSLPVGSYRTVLVPFLMVMFTASAVASALTLRGGRLVPFAATAIVVPVMFGAVFGSSTVSAPVQVGSVQLVAPRELALWLCAFSAAIAWVAWASGRDRRAALKRGRRADAEMLAATAASAASGNQQGRSAVRRNAAIRGSIAGVLVLAALAGAFVLAPVVNGEVRTVPRDRIDPELIVRSGVSPLAAYRASKRDATLKASIFSVTSEEVGGELPSRLRIAVLSGYDGVDFSVGDPAEAGRFTRFPSGGSVPDTHRVTVTLGSGYESVWVPLAPPLAAPPAFSGPRASELEESFYLNREMGSAIAVPGGSAAEPGYGMLRDGDGYTASMSGAGDADLGERPVSDQPLFDVEAMPALERWLALQDLPATGTGVTKAVERLRERGYLSHSLTSDAGEGAWLNELGTSLPIRFVSSPGGHSEARIDQLFEQLVEQEIAAGEGAVPAMLVAGIGNDEQFAAAGALVARAMGFDSRVVVGVRLSSDDSGRTREHAGVPGVPACATVCAGENLAAWIEVRGADGVWAPLDVSPQIEIPPTMLQKGEQLPEFPTQPEEKNAGESDPPVGMSGQESGSNAAAEHDELESFWGVLRTVAVVALGLALLALLVLFIPLLKMHRSKRRRHTTSPELRVLGAWDELLDTYRDTGFDAPAGEGRTATMGTLGIDGGDWIAWTVDQAVYSFEGITADSAAQLWEVVDARIAERRATLGRWARVRARFSLASFGGATLNGSRGARRWRATKGA